MAVVVAAAVSDPAGAVEIGAVVPDFTAAALDGAPFSLAEAVKTHEAVVVLFLSTVCPYSKYYSGHLRELDERYRRRGVLFVGVNSNQFESADEMREQAREYHHAFPLIRDDGSRIADAMGAERTPEAFVVAADGTLRYRGWIKSKVRSPDLQRAIEAVVAGKRVRRAETRTYGCAIDRPNAATVHHHPGP